jgi:AraC-like DNA-binding protein
MGGGGTMMGMRTKRNNSQKNTAPALPVIHAIGRSIFDPIWAENEHSDPRSELIFVLRGQVTVRTRDYSITAQEGDTIYTPRNVPHRDIFPAGSVYEVYMIQFLWNGEDELLKTITPVEMTKCAKNSRRLLAEDFTRLFQDFASHRENSLMMVQLRLQEIIFRISQEENDQEEKASTLRRHQIMQQAKEMILRNFNRQISLDIIAETLDISSYYLSRIFSEESGFTLSHYLTQVRLEKAVELLEDPRRNVSEIAFKTGFKDSHYFSRVFKAHFGCAPKEYRTRGNPSQDK